MRVPNLQRSPSFMQQIGLLVCGGVIGAAVMTGMNAETVQSLQYRISDLEAERNDLVSQVESFEKVRNRRNVIDRTSVRWEGEQRDYGKATLDALRDRVASDLLKLVGQPVNAELHSIYREIINGKVYTNVNGKDYRIRLTMLSIVGTECIVYIQAEEFIRSD